MTKKQPRPIGKKTLEECRKEIWSGVLFESVAGQRGIDPDHLAEELKIKNWRNLYTTGCMVDT